MTDLPSGPVDTAGSPPPDPRAVLERLDALKRGATEIRDALTLRIAALRDPSSAHAKLLAQSRAKLAAIEYGCRRRQLRSNLLALCVATLILAWAAAIAWLLIALTVTLWRTSI